MQSGEDIDKANAIAQKLRDELNAIIDKHGINWCVYGRFSGFWIYKGRECDKKLTCDFQMCEHDHALMKSGGDSELGRIFRIGMLINGIDITPSIGMTSSAHSLDDVEKTVRAFDATIAQMKKEKVIK